MEKRVEPFVGRYEGAVDGKHRMNLPIDVQAVINSRNPEGSQRHVLLSLRHERGDQSFISLADDRQFDTERKSEYRVTKRANLDFQDRFLIPYSIFEKHPFKSTGILEAAPDGSHMRIWQPEAHVTRAENKQPRALETLVASDAPFVEEHDGAVWNKMQLTLPSVYHKQLQKRNGNNAKVLYATELRDPLTDFAFIVLYDCKSFDALHAQNKINCADYQRIQADTQWRLVVPANIREDARLFKRCSFIPTPDREGMMLWSTDIYRAIEKKKGI